VLKGGWLLLLGQGLCSRCRRAVNPARCMQSTQVSSSGPCGQQRQQQQQVHTLCSSMQAGLCSISVTIMCRCDVQQPAPRGGQVTHTLVTPLLAAWRRSPRTGLGCAAAVSSMV
jgi:hypothetical protein